MSIPTESPFGNLIYNWHNVQSLSNLLMMMSGVLFFVSCIDIIVCMFAVMRFHILMFLVKVFSDFHHDILS